MSYKLVWTVIASLGVLTTGCSYGSLYEAEKACKEWEAADKKLTYRIQRTKYTTLGYERWDGPSQADIDNASESHRGLLELEAEMAKAAGYKRLKDGPFYEVKKTKTVSSRSCHHEEETEQYLGRTRSIINQKDLYDEDKGQSPEYKESVTRRFKY